MKRFIVILLLLPLGAVAQGLKINDYDQLAKERRLESFPVNLKSAPEIKMDVSLRSAGPSFFLQLTGSGIGANTVGVDGQVIFLLDNDSTVTLKSPRLQAFDYSKSVKTYRHEYGLSVEDLESLSRHDLQALRKYSVEGFDDIYIDKKNAGKLKDLTALFLEQLKKEDVQQAKISSTKPGFPGGTEVLLNFLNRNLKPVSELNEGEKKLAVIQFLVTADGSINDLRITQSAGPDIDNELLRILKRMPKWKPASANGKYIDAMVTQPLTFYRAGAGVKIQL